MRGIPDGEYFFAEYADEDSVRGKPMRVAFAYIIIISERAGISDSSPL